MLIVATLCLLAGPAALHPPAGALDDAAVFPVERTIPLTIRPNGLLLHDGRLYVSSFHESVIDVIDPVSGEQLDRFTDFDTYVFTRPVVKDGELIPSDIEHRPGSPTEMVLANGKLFVAQAFVRTLLVLDAATLKPLGRIEVEDGGGALALAPDRSTVYFTDRQARRVHVIDSETLESTTIAFPEGARVVRSLAISPDGDRLYLGTGGSPREAGATPPPPVAGPVNPMEHASGVWLAVYDLTEQRYIAHRSIGDTLTARDDDPSWPSAMSFSDDGDILYIAMWQCTVAVHVFDTREMELREPITVEGRHEVFPWPGGYDVLARGDDLIVTLDANRQLIVVDRHRREVRRVAALDDDGTRQPMSHIALDGQTLYVSHHGLQRVLVFDLALE